MKNYETRTETHTYKYIASLTCELCGRTTTGPDWSDGRYEVNEVEVTLRTGTNYPEGGNTIETTVDICPRCFETQLLPWVASKGGASETKDVDW